jgi:hypothetical protein
VGPFGVNIFHVDTQGLPYHAATSGVLMLAEYLFADYCLGSWQLRLFESMEMRLWLNDVFNCDLSIPICLDASRLWNRIEGVCGDIELTKMRFGEMFCGHHSQKINRLLAESRESTMRELAEQLLVFNSIDVQGAVELSDSFLDATDDLDMYLDLVDFRNSLATAQNKELAKEVIPIFTLESVLRMLIMHQVTITEWQCQELHDFKRWMTMDGDSDCAARLTLLRAFVPRIFDFYCSQSDLLDTFFRRDPSLRERLQVVANRAFAESNSHVERLTSMVRSVREKAEELYPIEDCEHPTPSPETFPQYMDAEARVMLHAYEPLTAKDVINLVKRTETLYYTRTIFASVSLESEIITR